MDDARRSESDSGEELTVGGAEGSRNSRRWKIVLVGVTALVLVVDVGSKHLVFESFGARSGPVMVTERGFVPLVVDDQGVESPRRDLIPGCLEFRLLLNPGGFGGVLGDRPFLLVVLSFLALAVWFRTFLFLGSSSRGFLIGTSLLFGGALGNLWDRIWIGAVRDFLHLYAGDPERALPTFNVADICILAGVFLILRGEWADRPTPAPGEE